MKNPTRLEKRVDNDELFSFTGTITAIEGSRVQLHIKKHVAAKDEYVECQFSSKRKVQALDAGSQVTLYGYLDKAFPTGKLGDLGFKDSKAVKFKNCGSVPAR